MARRGIYAVYSVLVLSGCGRIAGIEALPCELGCKDEATRIVCDADGNARAEACPSSPEECAVPACEAGACSFKPAAGAPCGETGGGRCNEGFACLGGYYYLGGVYRHTCLATDDGKAWCWGDNTYGQLGDGTDRPGLHPVLVRGLPGHAIKANAGYGHSCAILRNGELYCWGNNQDGQCGVLPLETISAPRLVGVPGMQFTEVMPGEKHTCALAIDKTVYCWGNTRDGQCGSDPQLTGSDVVGPTKVRGLDDVDRITTAKNHNCAVRSNAPTLVCWGKNSDVQPPGVLRVNGKLGQAAGDLPYSAAPVPVDLGSAVTAIGSGVDATYAVTQDRKVYAWGANDFAQLGVPSREKVVRTPTPVVVVRAGDELVELRGVNAPVRSGAHDACILMANRLEFESPFLCWGTDEWGELGLGTERDARTAHPLPRPVLALPRTIDSLVRGEDHACGGVFVGDRLEIWCYGRPGALADGTPRAEDGAPPTRLQGAPVVWDPANFASALE